VPEGTTVPATAEGWPVDEHELLRRYHEQGDLSEAEFLATSLRRFHEFFTYHVSPAAVDGDEAEALLGVEPFDCALRHCDPLPGRCG